MATFLTPGNTMTHSALSSRSFGMLSGTASTSLTTVAAALRRSSSFPWAPSGTTDSPSTTIASLCMPSSLARLTGRVELEDRIERGHDRHRHAEPGRAPDDGALKRFHFDPFPLLEIDEQGRARRARYRVDVRNHALDDVRGDGNALGARERLDFPAAREELRAGERIGP